MYTSSLGCRGRISCIPAVLGAGDGFHVYQQSWVPGTDFMYTSSLGCRGRISCIPAVLGAGDGFHVYQQSWVPKNNNELLGCLYEKDNPIDRFAIKTIAACGKIVGHLLIEISRLAKFLLDRGANVNAILLSTARSRIFFILFFLDYSSGKTEYKVQSHGSAGKLNRSHGEPEIYNNNNK